MITIDLVCEACGEPNPPGTEFCRNCNGYLAWDGDASAEPTVPSGREASTVDRPTISAPTDQGLRPEAEQSTVGTQTYPEQAHSDHNYADQQYADQQYADFDCPICGTVNPATRRYCGHCGYSFVADDDTDPYADWSGWTPQAMAARDREARREYRRSLPPLYRWRRVIIAVLVLALCVGLGALLRRDPVSLAKSGWYRLTKDYVPVAGVQAQVDPPSATAPGSDPAAAVDGTVAEWTMVWAPTGESECGAAPGTGTLVLTFPATRVRQIRVNPGLDQTNPLRDRQPQPKVIGISFDGGACQPFPLQQTATVESLDADSGTTVTQVRIGIASAYPAPADAKPLISLTEVRLMTFPS
ncbi:MAG: zinc ribbon domain-containing protein [Microlunatus sp.]|nr:zinc ribbon domain-containing protein [Microlunatus sp.]